MTSISSTPEWRRLKRHAKAIEKTHLRTLFADDPERAQRFTFGVESLTLDLSKQRLTEDVLSQLLQLARAVDLEAKRDAMFRGEKINITEDRAVLHTALRTQRDDPIYVDGEDIIPGIRAVQERLYAAATALREGRWLGYTGKQIKNVVNIGIGGSDLGPVMVTEALKHYSQRDMRVSFISNIDATHFVEVTRELNPEETLFIIASKTFTTDETLTNAHTARQWLVGALGSEDAVASHFIALSTNLEATGSFGIAPENVFEFWDWVGGRYSLTSAIGLSIIIAIGPDNFKELLRGFAAMDEHFAAAPLEENLPVLLGMVGVWNSNFLGASTHAILPYDQYLHRFPAYLQQADMESNGKSVTLSGERSVVTTGSVVWGEPGTNGQHAFYQLIHQGTHRIPVDFIGFKEPLHQYKEHHDKLCANMLAQSGALAFGKTLEEVREEGASAELAPHKVFDGNKPSTTIMIERLTPYTLGQLIALYEHVIFTQGVIWNLDSFDQWGVELGKGIAKSIYQDIHGDQLTPRDSSTDALLRNYMNPRA